MPGSFDGQRKDYPERRELSSLQVSGPFACFTRPEMKVERVSYDVITPSAARSVFEAILWKPQIRWRITRIEVLNPIRWINLRRNEVGAVVSTRNVQQAMNAGSGNLGLYIEDERQQRAGLFLRDVAYRLHAELILSPVALVAPDPVLFSTVGLSPLTATNPVGTDHTVTAFAQAANNAPVPGVTINFNKIPLTANDEGVITYTYKQIGYRRREFNVSVAESANYYSAPEQKVRARFYSIKL